MPLSIAYTPANLLGLLNQRLAAAVPSRDETPPIKIVDANLDPASPDPSLPRAGYQARLGPLYGKFGSPALLAAPSSADAAILLDWSSPASIDSAETVARRCLASYMRGLAAMGKTGAAQAAAIEAELTSAMERLMEAARAAMEHSRAIPPPEARARFEAMCSATPANPTLAAKSALRASLERLPADEAKALLQASPVEFSAKIYLEQAERAAQEASEPATAPAPAADGGMRALGGKLASRRAQQACSLRRNGSFSSSEFASRDSLNDMAKLASAPGLDMGMEHMAHRHYLILPDGEVHGFENIVAWGREFMANTEALHIAAAASPAPSAPKPPL